MRNLIENKYANLTELKNKLETLDVYKKLCCPLKNASAEQIKFYNEQLTKNLRTLSEEQILRAIESNGYIDFFLDKKLNYKNIDTLFLSLIEDSPQIINEEKFWNFVLKKESFLKSFITIAQKNIDFNIINFLDNYTDTFKEREDNPDTTKIQLFYYQNVNKFRDKIFYPLEIRNMVNNFILNYSSIILEEIKNKKTNLKLIHTNFIAQNAKNNPEILNLYIEYNKNGTELNLAQYYFIKSGDKHFQKKYKDKIDSCVKTFIDFKVKNQKFYDFLSTENPSLLLSLEVEKSFEHLIAPAAMYLLRKNELEDIGIMESQKWGISEQKLKYIIEHYSSIDYLKQCLKYLENNQHNNMFGESLKSNDNIKFLQILLEKKNLESNTIQKNKIKALKI